MCVVSFNYDVTCQFVIAVKVSKGTQGFLKVLVGDVEIAYVFEKGIQGLVCTAMLHCVGMKCSWITMCLKEDLVHSFG